MAQGIFKGDNTGAFGNNFITIKIKNPDLFKINKVVFSVNSGCIKKTFTDPNYFMQAETILTVNFDSSETMKLNEGANVGNVIYYDEQDRQDTAPQSIRFFAQNGVIKNVGCCC